MAAWRKDSRSWKSIDSIMPSQSEGRGPRCRWANSGSNSLDPVRLMNGASFKVFGDVSRYLEVRLLLERAEWPLMLKHRCEIIGNISIEIVQNT